MASQAIFFLYTEVEKTSLNMKFKNISTSSIHSIKKIVPDYHNNYREPLGVAGGLWRIIGGH